MECESCGLKFEKAKYKRPKDCVLCQRIFCDGCIEKCQKCGKKICDMCLPIQKDGKMYCGSCIK